MSPSVNARIRMLSSVLTGRTRLRRLSACMNIKKIDMFAIISCFPGKPIL